MVGIDRHGITLDVTTPGGPRLARLGFPEPLTSADDARPAVIAMARFLQNRDFHHHRCSDLAFAAEPARQQT
jgi:putative heme iron utilization protein